MTSIFPLARRPDRYFGPGLSIVERRPQNSNQDMDKPKHLVDDVYRCTFQGRGEMQASERAVLQFRHPKCTRM